MVIEDPSGNFSAQLNNPSDVFTHSVFCLVFDLKTSRVLFDKKRSFVGGVLVISILYLYYINTKL
jgi:hypothetical protein